MSHLCQLTDRSAQIAFDILCREVGEWNDRLEKELNKAKQEIDSLRATVSEQNTKLQQKDVLLFNKEEHISELLEENEELRDELHDINAELDEAEHRLGHRRHRFLRNQFHRQYCRELEKWIQQNVEPAIDLDFLAQSFRAHYEEHWNLDDFELDLNMRRAL